MSIIHRPVLVLNRTWAPVHVLPVYKAIIRACNNRAEIIDTETYMKYSWEEWAMLDVVGEQPYIRISQEPFKIRAPEVIVAVSYSKIPKCSIKLNRENIWSRDNGTCQYTGRKLKKEEADIDHIVPRSRGGGNHWENVVLCDKKVNANKANKTPEEAGLELKSTPIKPQWSPVYRLKGKRVPDSWKNFISEDD